MPKGDGQEDAEEDGALWFRDLLAEIFGYGAQSHLARLIKQAGDDRDHKTILRTISNFASGKSRVPGEVRALLMVLRRPRDALEMLHRAKWPD